MFNKWMGPILVAIAALLWATDAPFRATLAARLDPTTIVLVEHFIGATVLLFFSFFGGEKFSKLGLKDWLLLAFVGVGGSGVATLLFTAAFAHMNPSVIILLQKLQPIFVVLVAYAFLGERPKKGFYLWAAIALGATIALTIPYLQLLRVAHSFNELGEQAGAFYAVGAAALWGASTVAGKTLVERHSPSLVTFWRYAFGFCALLLIHFMTPTHYGVMHVISSKDSILALLYLGLISGLLSLVIYYRGLRRTPASVAAFVELIYPAAAVLMNAWLLKATLSLSQAVAATVLLFSVLQIAGE